MIPALRKRAIVLIAAAMAIFTLLPAMAASATGFRQERTVVDVEYLGVDEFAPTPPRSISATVHSMTAT